MPKTKEEIQNCLSSELFNLMYEFESGMLTKEELLRYVCSLLIDAEVDSESIVYVLDKLGDEGKTISTEIKVNEGW